MKLYVAENNIDPDFFDIYYFWGKRKMLFATVPQEVFNQDMLEEINEIVTYKDVELEIKIV